MALTVLCRHWRYISAFHGPWLQLPHEILETLAHSNFISPRPRQTDPSVLFDLLKVRKLVDEAADLAVRAQNGTASSALSAENGLPGAALGLNTRGGAGGNAKLSPERKYRMRELATAKLSRAYRLDEIAASVATMQAASALDNVASLVLQRAPQNTDAQYVHFFHEKIPSRMMAECTPLEPLNQIIARGLGHAALYRTRALTKIFKEDFVGAAQDLTEALVICRNEQARHVTGKNQLVTQRQAQEDAERRKIWTKEWISENRVLEEDQPEGLEMQLLFQRGNQYLTIASSHVKRALEAFGMANKLKQKGQSDADVAESHSKSGQSVERASGAGMDAYRRGLESRELVRKFAKRALRDYTTFFSHLDYAVASDPRVADAFDRGRVLGEEDEEDSSADGTSTSSALVRRQPQSSSDLTGSFENLSTSDNGIKMHDMATVLSSKPPEDLPSFPTTLSTAVALSNNPNTDSTPSTVHTHEMLTYHPLLPETLHSFLLTHCLLQTAPTTLHRIAINAARLTRLADGYPFFLSARSPARADWVEVLRQTNNWIGLTSTWDNLCKADLPSDNGSSEKSGTTRETKHEGGVVKGGTSLHRQTPGQETAEQRRDRIHKEAVMEALGDERVVDDESFQKAVKARERRALRESDPMSAFEQGRGINGDGAQANGTSNGEGTQTQRTSESTHRIASRSASDKASADAGSPVAKDEEYLIGTERAECIAKWIMEAPANPVPVDGMGTKPRKKKKSAAKRAALSHQSSDLNTLTETTTAD